MNKRAKSNTIRIIAGRWRGRRLPVVDSEGLRPTTDRVRETLFNWLMHDLPGARCLDLFAGTGVLGLESLSRGASRVVFVEVDEQVATTLSKTLDVLGPENSLVNVASASHFIDGPCEKGFDIVFLDPPFRSDLLPAVLKLLSENGWLAEQALVYVEQSVNDEPAPTPEGWKEHRSGQAGQSRFSLYLTP